MQSPRSDNNATSKSDLQELVNDVERDLLFHIVTNMEHRKLSVEQAHLLAKDFLKLLPAQDKEDLLKKLLELGKTYSEAQDVYVKYGKNQEEQNRNTKLNMMRDHIQNGDIEKALEVAKGGTQNG